MVLYETKRNELVIRETIHVLAKYNILSVSGILIVIFFCHFTVTVKITTITFTLYLYPSRFIEIQI